MTSSTWDRRWPARPIAVAVAAAAVAVAASSFAVAASAAVPAAASTVATAAAVAAATVAVSDHLDRGRLRDAMREHVPDLPGLRRRWLRL